MALATYNDLLASIASTTHRSDLTSVIPDFVTMADSRINTDLRHRYMETTQASTVVSGVIAVPTNYIELKDAYISSLTPYVNLERKTSEWIYEKYPYRTQGDIPRFIAREGSNFIFGPYSSDGYVVTLVYYNRFAALSSAVNSVFSAYPGLWLYYSLGEAYSYIKDEQRSLYWFKKYQDAFNLVQKESEDEFLSGGVLTVVAG